MVFKTLIAAICAAGLAGSVVYFSTAPNGTSGSVKLDKPVSERVLVEKSSKKKPNIIDRYVNPAKDNDSKAETKKVENPYKSANSPSDNTNTRVELAETEKPAELEGKLKNKPKTKPVLVNPKAKKDIDPAQMRINAVFKEAERISQPDLRDRAYLDLTDYATNKGMFDQAKKAALRIKQVELRDTARSRIAMGMARYGQAEEAFALINKVEVKELRDVMRLQVIEALLGTDIRR